MSSTTYDDKGHVVKYERDCETLEYVTTQKEERAKFVKETEEEIALILSRCENPGLAYYRLMQYSRVVMAAMKVFLAKNDEYGDAIRTTGLLGVVVEFVGNAARLKKMVMKNPTHGRTCSIKSLKNALVDALNYAVFGLFWLEEGNYDGED